MPVAWHPDSAANEHLFVSGDYNGIAKVWNVRCTIPLHTVKAHKGKLLGLSWWCYCNNDSHVAFVTWKLNFFAV